MNYKVEIKTVPVEEDLVRIDAVISDDTDKTVFMVKGPKSEPQVWRDPLVLVMEYVKTSIDYKEARRRGEVRPLIEKTPNGKTQFVTDDKGEIVYAVPGAQPGMWP